PGEPDDLTLDLWFDATGYRWIDRTVALERGQPRGHLTVAMTPVAPEDYGRLVLDHDLLTPGGVLVEPVVTAALAREGMTSRGPSLVAQRGAGGRPGFVLPSGPNLLAIR